MAVMDVDPPEVTAEGYISDESSFYGDEEHRTHLETLSCQSSTLEGMRLFRETIPAIAAAAELNLSKPSDVPKDTLYNLYQSLLCARQLSETVASFLERLPPSTTREAEYGPWIYIANPYSGKRPLKEDWAGFTQAGEQFLEEWTEKQMRIRKDMAGQTESVIKRRVTRERKEIELRLRQMASEKKCTTGKWMLFLNGPILDSTWSLISHATATNELGIGAKVATDHGSAEQASRLICIYTADFNDMDDVTRVLRKMVEMGIVHTSRHIYYKCDAYTHLGLNSGNEYGIQASMFSSKGLLNKPLRDSALPLP